MSTTVEESLRRELGEAGRRRVAELFRPLLS